MEYQPLSDPGQLRVLEGLTHLLLHGVLLVIAVAAVVLLCLYLSELCPPQRRLSEVEERGWRATAGPLLAARRRASLGHLTPIRLWAGGAEGRVPVAGGSGGSDGAFRRTRKSCRSLYGAPADLCLTLGGLRWSV